MDLWIGIQIFNKFIVLNTKIHLIMRKFLIFILGLLIGGLAMHYYNSKPKEETVVRSTPKGLIAPDQAKTLDRAYNQRHKLISDSIVKRKDGDNRSSWYALDDLRNYLNYAEKEATELGYTMNGVRIYLGAYPDENGEAGYTTMFFIPTGKSNKAAASMFNYSLMLGDDDDDIPGASGLNFGTMGHPPHANYPQ